MKYKKFKLGELFDVDSWVYGKNKQWITRFDNPSSNRIPVISGITINNGINYYTTDNYSKEEVFENELTISTRGEYSGTITYHEGKFLLANNILVMKMPGLNYKQKLFIASVISKIGYGGYNNYPRKETLKEDYVYLPSSDDKQPDYDYMNAYLSELEKERLSALDKYLKTTGLNNYELTEDEKDILNRVVDFKEFNIIKICKVVNTHSILKDKVIFNSGNIPYVTASEGNNSVVSYIDAKSDIIDKGNCVLIGGKTMVVTYQEKDFVSNDSHNLALYLLDENYQTKNVYLYLTSAIYKSLGMKYHWGDSISKKKIQEDVVKLPINDNGTPNYDYMEKFIAIIEKLAIKDVVNYKNNIND